jgi:hypothetical protein
MYSKFFHTALTTLMMAVLMGCGALVLAKDNKYEARQHGYEHGYRDGYHRGREAMAHHSKYDLKTDDYKEGDRGYDKHMGNEGEYKEGYRTGYQNGYDDAFYSRPGRFAEIYARDDRDRDRDRDREVVITEPGFYPDMAYDNGYRDGIRNGQKDVSNHANFDPAEQPSYRDGDHGYRASYGDIEAYKRQYREGFMRGYQDGYGRWR